jgi:hypothetical protein
MVMLSMAARAAIQAPRMLTKNPVIAHILAGNRLISKGFGGI